MSQNKISALGPRLDIGRLLANAPPKLDFVLPGLPAGTVGMLNGTGGVGKTMFELHLAIVIAAGLPWSFSPLSALMDFEQKRCPERVLLVLAEESETVVWRRLHAVVDNIVRSGLFEYGLTAADIRTRLDSNLMVNALAGSRRLQLLDEALQPGEHYASLRADAEGARLVILDPLRQFHVENENESGAMSALVSVFKRLAHDTGAAVVCAHHSSRSSGQFGYAESADASRGSTALVDDTRWVVTLSEPTNKRLKQFGVTPSPLDQYVVLAAGKMNYVAKSPPGLLSRDASGVFSPVTKANAGASARRSHRR